MDERLEYKQLDSNIGPFQKFEHAADCEVTLEPTIGQPI